MRPRRVHWPRLARDSVIFAIGAGGLVRELVFPSATGGAERIYAWIAVLISPIVVRANERYKQNGNGRDDERDRP